MLRVTTSLRIDTDVREYSKIAAMREGFTFTAYYENLLLKNMKDNHFELYEEYLNSTSPKEAIVKTKNRSPYVKARFEGREVKDIAGVILSPAREGEELDKERELMKKTGLL